MGGERGGGENGCGGAEVEEEGWSVGEGRNWKSGSRRSAHLVAADEKLAEMGAPPPLVTAEHL